MFQFFNDSIQTRLYSNQFIFFKSKPPRPRSRYLPKMLLLLFFYSHKRVGELLFTCWVGHLTHWLRIFYLRNLIFKSTARDFESSLKCQTSKMNHHRRRSALKFLLVPISFDSLEIFIEIPKFDL